MCTNKASWRLLLIFFVLIAGMSYADEETPRKALTKAIQAGNLKKVQSIIDSTAVGIEEVPTNDYEGITPLVEASISGQFSIMKYLIEKGASVEGLSGKKSTPLTAVIGLGSSKLSCQQLMEVTRFLINSGADVNCAGSNGYTPLINACKNTKCHELMEMLIDLGALIDTQADDKKSALFMAIEYTNIKAFQLLLKHGASTHGSYDGVSLFGFAALKGNLVMAKLVLDELKVDVNAYDPAGGTPLCWAALNGHDSLITFLTERGADVNAKTANPINVEVPPKSRYHVSLSKTYVTFPKDCTALNFAKYSEVSSTIKLIRRLGGTEREEVELKEWTSFDWRR